MSSPGGGQRPGGDPASLAAEAFIYGFALGALDDERWKIADDPAGYLKRALAARGGLRGNHGYEAAYAMVYVDVDGNALDGSGAYELRFAKPPPCRAFWSVTMYDRPDFDLFPIRSTATQLATERLGCAPTVTVG